MFCDSCSVNGERRYVGQGQVSPPAVVRAGDLVAAVWPPGSTLRRPSLRCQALMGPAGAALDFELRPSGAAHWCEVHRFQGPGLRGHLPHRI